MLSEPACKPDPVVTHLAASPGDHPSGTSVTARLVRPTRRYPLWGRAGHPCLLLGLAPDGVYLAAPIARHAGELLPHRFTLTSTARGATLRPYLEPSSGGGLLSVALATARAAWNFLQRPALWSPDFPRRRFLRKDAAVTRPAPSTRTIMALRLFRRQGRL